MSENQKWYDKIAIIQKLKNIKHIEIIIAVIFGIIIFLIYFSTINSTSTQTNSSQTEFEQRLCAILDDIEGAGNVSVFVNTSESTNEIIGIIIVSSGAGQTKVRLEILKAVQTVLSVPTTNIEILVGNK